MKKSGKEVDNDATLTIDLSVAEPIGENVAVVHVSHFMVLVVDMDENMGPTESGGSLAIASTRGFRLIDKSTRVSLWIGRKLIDRRKKVKVKEGRTAEQRMMD
jgi:hypothetical protein